MFCEDALFTAIPVKLALLCFVLNLFPLPGLGTLVHAHFGSQGDNLKVRRCIIGFAQFILAFLIFNRDWDLGLVNFVTLIKPMAKNIDFGCEVVDC